MQKISFKTIYLLKIRYTIVFCLISFCIGSLSIINLLIVKILIFPIVITYSLIMIVYAKLNFKNSTYKLYNKLIIINFGVLIKNQISINTSKLQYIKLVQTPLQRKLSICTLIFHLSGSKARLSNLDLDIGIQIKNKILKKL